MSKPSLDHHTQPLGLETLSLLPAQWSGHSPGLPICAVPVCLSTDKSDAISGNCRRPGSWPLPPPYNLSPSPLPPWGWQHWARGVVTGAGPRSRLVCTWLPGGTSQQHSKMPELLAKAPRPLSLQPSVAPPLPAGRKQTETSEAFVNK